MSAPTRPAATVIVVRPEEDGFSIFMVRRHRRSGFMPDAWVFPGGRVDDADRLAGHPAIGGGERVIERMGLDPADAVAFLVASVRETWEEAGIWLGSGRLPEASRFALQRGEITLRQLLEEHGATVDLDRLRAWSWWITPKIEPKRYDTRFLVALAGDDRGSHDEHETVESRWMRPLEAIDDPDVKLAPPTWWTLRELSELGSVDDVLAAARKRPQQAVMPILEIEGQSVQLILPGHAKHPDPPVPGFPSAIRFDRGRWWAD